MSLQMPLARYLESIRATWSTGDATPENSYVPHLMTLLEGLLEDEVVAWPRGNDEGLPDLGLRSGGILEGFVEAEAIGRTLPQNTKGQRQAKRYSNEAPTLLTNFYDFWVIDREEVLRQYSLTRLGLLERPIRDVIDEHGENLRDILTFWAQRRTPITGPDALAERLAEYARTALRHVEDSPGTELTSLRRAMEEALGFKFETNTQHHFFKSSLVQSLFYGLFSAWMHAARTGRQAPRSLQEAAALLDVPVVSQLFEELSQHRRQLALGLAAPVEWALDALLRVVPDEFMRTFESGEAVQYFYEPFLEKFDRRLRRELAVWYTPREIVRFQVETTDRLLREEVGIERGLLDERVVVLDPAVGTGSYLVEIARYMHERLEGDALRAHTIKDAFLNRILGFEILPAPFAIAHLQIGLYLRDVGAPLQPNERASIYLTNSLVGWEPRPADAPDPVFPEFAVERALADRVKQERAVLVVIGNPPYSRFTSQAEDEQADLIAPYKACLSQTWDVRRNTLDDLYIRFIRLAERQIAEMGTRTGIVSLITNRSYLNGLSHPVMRQHLLKSFDKLLIDDLHGSVRAGRPDDGNVFSTQSSSGITVGVAVGHFVKTTSSAQPGLVVYRELRDGSGEQKRRALLAGDVGSSESFTPGRTQRYSFRPLRAEDVYFTWNRLTDVFPAYYSGVQASRDAGPMAFDFQFQALSQRMSDYYDPALSNDEVAEMYPDLMRNGANYNASAERLANLRDSGFQPSRIVPYMYRPLDRRLLYWEENGNLLVRKRKEYFDQVWEGNRFLIANQIEERDTTFDRVAFASGLTEFHVLRPDARAFPLRVHGRGFLAGLAGVLIPNLADYFDLLVEHRALQPPRLSETCAPPARPLAVLTRFGIEAFDGTGNPTVDAVAFAETLFYYATGVLASPIYGRQFREFLSDDWPRIPIPDDRHVIEEMATLGRNVADLLDPWANVSASFTLDSGIRLDGAGSAPSTLTLLNDFQHEDSRVQIADGLWLAGVDTEAWAFTIGGYPVLNSWLKARANLSVNVNELRTAVTIAQRITALIDIGDQLDSKVEPLLR